MNDWARKIREGDARSLARAATGVENRDPQALEVLRELAPFAGHARIVGITGPPGAGKSTLVDTLASELRRQAKTLAILAVDPTSRRTGGAILGDRIRMQQHHADPGIFIRSMATRGTTGGLARATADLARLMDVAGRDYVLIETVGVGQDEVEIADLAQVTVVVLVPGMGDDVQAIKAGIMEIADIFVINKADQPGADRVERELHAEAHNVPILRTIATTGTGVPELLDAIRGAGTRACRLDTRVETFSALPTPDFHHAAESAVGQVTDLPTTKPKSTVPDHHTGHVGHQPHIDHLGIAVPALDAAVAFYQTLGLSVTHRETVATEKVNVAMLPAGDSRIELLEPASPDSPISKFLEKRGPGLHHVALLVPDLPAAVERLRAAGARLLNEPRQGAGGHLYVFVHPASTGGVLLELIQEAGH
ncbi:MAG TPA: methylmalonyl Co-A mutase-associated GTPase MeaB [Bryobacteraceae bacterium]|jgi:LAO/AO transport system kinase|nr:methylmalonyl Co-A mutase-associated GTPase MeaB [Bryobacteraceae bacterium]